ncbi:hypothetical protein CN933_13610 [Sinorhizobium sp. M4_45]|nr:hypothetical protein CN933_13610 [Sinorhizobium sp. M4_45]
MPHVAKTSAYRAIEVFKGIDPQLFPHWGKISDRALAEVAKAEPEVQALIAERIAPQPTRWKSSPSPNGGSPTNTTRRRSVARWRGRKTENLGVLQGNAHLPPPTWVFLARMFIGPLEPPTRRA